MIEAVDRAVEAANSEAAPSRAASVRAWAMAPADFSLVKKTPKAAVFAFSLPIRDKYRRLKTVVFSEREMKKS